MSGPVQPKVEDEQWSDERIRAFLELKPVDSTNRDYHVLIQAYLHMVPSFFTRFLVFFEQAGRDINAKSDQGETILDLVSEHRRSTEYAGALKTKGAKLSSELA